MLSIIDQRYRIGNRCFTPPIGEAFYAYDLSLFRSVTIWLLPKTRRALATVFLSEQDKVLDIGSDYTPKLYDKGIDSSSGIPYLVFEPIKTQTLESMYSNGNLLPRRKSLAIFGNLLECQSIFHEANIVHGSLNPMSLLIFKDTLQVIGFGLSNIYKVNELPLKMLSFLPPEQLLGKAPKPLFDLYSAGAILYNTLTGNDVLTSGDIKAVRNHSYDTSTLRETINSDTRIHRDVQPLLLKILLVEPFNYYLNANAILEDLAKIKA